MNNPSYGFLALAMRQSLIKRWSIMHSLRPESVLEHSAIVSLLAMLTGHIAQQLGKEVSIEKMISHALVHDLEEILRGDVITPVKKATPAIESEFKKLAHSAEEQLLKTLPDSLKGIVEESFNPGGYEQRLVKACDVYAAYIKCKLEVSAGNSVEFGDALRKTEETLQKVKYEHPEIVVLDTWFGDGFGQSVDQLLSGGSDV
jgi:5'-deoxynucleotidase